MKIRVLIVDDETLARARVRNMLAAEPELEVAGECASGIEAIAFIRDRRPDLVFLDVQMPEVNGFDVLRALPPESWPLVIFVTAHDQHALEAFEVHALDYLLKPFKEARFRAAIERARRQLQSLSAQELNQKLRTLLDHNPPPPAYPTQLAVKSGEKTVFVKLVEVDYFEAAANYLIVHVGSQNHILRETLLKMESRVSPKAFMRINRSVIVNLARVKEVRSGLGNTNVVVLKNGADLPLTRPAREIQQRLEFL
jgi:two-component system, LytTR family, response regulator